MKNAGTTKIAKNIANDVKPAGYWLLGAMEKGSEPTFLQEDKAPLRNFFLKVSKDVRALKVRSGLITTWRYGAGLGYTPPPIELREEAQFTRMGLLVLTKFTTIMLNLKIHQLLVLDRDKGEQRNMEMAKKQELILVLDFGSQYNQLITRRIREMGVYSELHDHEISIEEIKKMNPKGIILSGGPNSVYEEGSFTIDPEIYNLGIPVLGICYGRT